MDPLRFITELLIENKEVLMSLGVSKLARKFGAIREIAPAFPFDILSEIFADLLSELADVETISDLNIFLNEKVPECLSNERNRILVAFVMCILETAAKDNVNRAHGSPTFWDERVVNVLEPEVSAAVSRVVASREGRKCGLA